MHTVMWTFQVPLGTRKQDLIATINATAHTYQGIPGLIRKYYGIAEDGALACGHLPVAVARRGRSLLRRRVGGHGDQALGCASFAAGVGNSDGR